MKCIAAAFFVAADALSFDSEWKFNAVKSLEAAGVPDPQCHTVKPSIDGKHLVCCAGYCDECSDYPTCGSVRGQDSEKACCKTKVYAQRCGEAPANVRLKSCDEAVPPCIMSEEEIVIPETERHAGDDCNEAIALFSVACGEITKNGSFELAGMLLNLKLKKKKPATPAKKGINPFTKELCGLLLCDGLHHGGL